VCALLFKEVSQNNCLFSKNFVLAKLKYVTVLLNFSVVKVLTNPRPGPLFDKKQLLVTEFTTTLLEHDNHFCPTTQKLTA